MRDLLGPTTAYHRILADVTGGVNAGLLLSRLLQLQRKSVESGYPWFSLTALNWQEDLALNRRSLENAKDKLKELGLVQEFYLNRGAKRVYTQVDPALLCKLLEAQFAFKQQPERGLRWKVWRPRGATRHSKCLGASRGRLCRKRAPRLPMYETDKLVMPNRKYQIVGFVHCRLLETCIAVCQIRPLL